MRELALRDGMKISTIQILMSLKLTFLRHGQTSSSRDNVFCGSGLNPDLTDEGAQMADLHRAHHTIPNRYRIDFILRIGQRQALERA